MNARNNKGAVLLIVVGISMTLLTMMVAFLAQMRTTAESTNPIVQSAQAKLMLHAALMYLQESSRLGWSEPGTPEETFGWTDIRDGSIGPRPARNINNGNIPSPSWWSGSGSYGDGFEESSNTDTWPMPGSKVRINGAVRNLTPYAIQMRKSYNPVRNKNFIHNLIKADESYDIGNGEKRVYEIMKDFTNQPTIMGMLDPQPIGRTWDDFADPTRLRSDALEAKVGTDTRSWFRIYRERLEDHDGEAPLNQPWLDSVTISERNGSDHYSKNWNIFVITVGSGATRGYKNWTEVTQDGAQQVFGSESVFNELRRREYVSWWRVEWSPIQGGGFDPATYKDGHKLNIETMRAAGNRTYGGNFSWIQKLAEEPPKW